MKPSAPRQQVEEAIDESPAAEHDRRFERGPELPAASEDGQESGTKERVLEPEQDRESQERRAQRALSGPGSRPQRERESEHDGQRGRRLAQRARGEVDHRCRERDDRGATGGGDRRRAIATCEPVRPERRGDADARERQPCETEVDAWIVGTDEPADGEQCRDEPGERPVPRAFDEFPGDETVPEDQAMGGLEALEDLVWPVDAIVIERKPGPDREPDDQGGAEDGERDAPLARLL